MRVRRRLRGTPGIYMDGCQNCGPSSGTLNVRCHIIIGIQKGTIILTTTHMDYKEMWGGCWLGTVQRSVATCPCQGEAGTGFIAHGKG